MAITTAARYPVVVLAVALVGNLAQGQNQIASAGFVYGPTPQHVAPGEILTLTTTALNVPNAVATGAPLPTSLSGVSVQARVIGATDATGYPPSLPILSIYTQSTGQMPDGVACPAAPNILCTSTQITVEIPTEGVCAPSPAPGPLEPCPLPPYSDLPPLLILNVVANGVTGPDFPVQFLGAWPHPLNSCDSIFGPQASSTCHPLVTHAGGSLVSVTDSSAAKVGETIVLYAVGLGGLINVPPTGSAPSASMQISASSGEVVFGYNYPVPSATTLGGGIPATSAVSQTVVLPQWVGLIPGYVGLYQVNVTVPPAPAGSYLACGSIGNVALSFVDPSGGNVGICVQP